jgi:hypothetical protein
VQRYTIIYELAIAPLQFILRFSNWAFILSIKESPKGSIRRKEAIVNGFVAVTAPCWASAHRGT